MSLDLLKKFADQLRECDSPNPIREVRIMLAHVLGQTYEYVYMMRSVDLSELQQDMLVQMVQRRAMGEPLAKILQQKGFWKHTFKTTSDTLDPRPESECVIEQVLKQKPDRGSTLRILDLGTGTGCLLLSLLHEYPNASGIGVDISMAACQVAQHNVEALGLAERALIINSSWLDSIGGKFDMIVSNPPYIGRSETVSEGASFDPSSALFANNDGMEHYDYFARQVHKYLTHDGIFVAEHGYQQHDLVVSCFTRNGFKLLDYALDLNQIRRVASFELS